MGCELPLSDRTRIDVRHRIQQVNCWKTRLQRLKVPLLHDFTGRPLRFRHFSASHVGRPPAQAVFKTKSLSLRTLNWSLFLGQGAERHVGRRLVRKDKRSSLTEVVGEGMAEGLDYFGVCAFIRLALVLRVLG